jgi:uncharacterized surface protein with fasciclin (FAS1) repeats
MEKKLNIMETAIRSGIFQTFTRLLEGSPIERELRSDTVYTLFAPADIAFAYLPAETLKKLLLAENRGILGHLLGYHAVPGKIMSSQLRDLRSAKTAYGESLIISNKGELRIEGARLLQKDIEAGNGVIHAIDRLLLPATATSSASA